MNVTADGAFVRAVGAVYFPVADLVGGQAHGGVVGTGVSGRLADGGLAGLLVRVVFTVNVSVTNPTLCDAFACFKETQTNNRRVMIGM